MALFPSREWMEAFCVEVAAHPDAGTTAQALDGVYRFVVEPWGAVLDPHVYDVEIRPDHGGAEIALVQHAGRPRLTIAARYDRWRQLLCGDLDIPVALMLRRLRVTGDVNALRRNLASARALSEALASVETEWIEG